MSAAPAPTFTGRAWSEVFPVFLYLGLTSFGGPVARLGYFRQEFVDKRRWLDETSYADIVGLCQFLPGPASSQVGISIGLIRAGFRGALDASAAPHPPPEPVPPPSITAAACSAPSVCVA